MHKSHLKISHTRTQQTHQVGKFNKENFVLHLQWSMISWSWSSFSMSARKFKTKFLCVWPFPSCNNFLFSPKFFPSKTFLLLFDAASLSGFNCFVSSHFVYPLHYNPLSKPLRKFSVCKEFFAPRTFHCWPNSIFVLKRNFQSLMLKFSREVEPLYGHCACRRKSRVEKWKSLSFACVGDELSEIFRSEKRDREEFSWSGEEMWKIRLGKFACLEARRNESQIATGGRSEARREEKFSFSMCELVKNGKCWARSFYCAAGKKATASIQVNTKALIRAAGDSSEGKSIFFIVLTFTSVRRRRVFKSISQGLVEARNFKWWKAANRGKTAQLLVCEKMFGRCAPGVFVQAKHFLIGGRSFAYKTIHLPVLRSQQPIEAQQESEKMFFSRGPPFSCP